MKIAVTGAFGYSGRYITERLLSRGHEVCTLMEDRLWVDAPPLGQTRLTDWIKAHRATLGKHYTSEMARRLNRREAYRSN